MLSRLVPEPRPGHMTRSPPGPEAGRRASSSRPWPMRSTRAQGGRVVPSRSIATTSRTTCGARCSPRRVRAGRRTARDRGGRSDRPGPGADPCLARGRARPARARGVAWSVRDRDRAVGALRGAPTRPRGSGLGPARRSPDRLPQLHAWAAGWHEATVRSSRRSSTGCGPIVRATRSAPGGRVGELYDGGHESTILRTIEAIPDSVASSDLQAMAEFAWCHLLVDRRRFVSLVGAHRPVGPRRHRPRSGPGRPHRGAEAMASTMTGNWADSGALARSAWRLSATRGGSTRWVSSPGT